MSALERLKAIQASKRAGVETQSMETNAPPSATSSGRGLWGRPENPFDGPSSSSAAGGPPSSRAPADGLNTQRQPSNRSRAAEGPSPSSSARPPQRTVAYPKHSAANAHVESDAYMERFERALLEMGLKDDAALEVLSSVKPGGARARPPPAHGTSGRSAAQHTTTSAGGPRGGRSGPTLGAIVTDDAVDVRLSGGWASGPLDPQGTAIALSERPLMCGAANWTDQEAVIGGSDHALYVLCLQKGIKKRSLFNKTYGHSEWVTACTYMDDGRIASIALDGKLMVWERGVVKAATALAHAGSASALQALRGSTRLVTCGYDKKIKLWEAGGARGPSELCVLGGHAAPVMTCRAQAESGRVVSGDRSGHVGLWDLEGGSCSAMHTSAHGGHVTCLAWGSDATDPEAAGLLSAAVFASGGQDGLLKLWDARSPGGPRLSVECHVNERGRGALGFVCPVLSTGLVATAGADGSVCLLDPRRNLEVVHRTRLTDFPYELKAAGALVLAGCGDGALHVIDTRRLATLYALGANRAAVRFVAARGDTLVAAGDDGSALIYRF